jgi:hypothetical protein
MIRARRLLASGAEDSGEQVAGGDVLRYLLLIQQVQVREAKKLLAEAQTKKGYAKAWRTLVEANSLDEEAKTQGRGLGYFSADDAYQSMCNVLCY